MMNVRWIAPAALIGLFAASSPADETKIEIGDLPKAVAKAAKKAFPEAKIVGAAKEVEDGETVFEVMMKLDGKSIDLAIDDDGEIQEIEREIEVEDLPRAVIKAARKKFPEGKIGKVEEVSDDEDKVIYELEIEVKGKPALLVAMSPNGKILEGEDEEGDEDEAKAKKAKDDDKEVKAKKEKEDDDEEVKAKPKAKPKKEKDDDENDRG